MPKLSNITVRLSFHWPDHDPRHKLWSVMKIQGGGGEKNATPTWNPFVHLTFICDCHEFKLKFENPPKKPPKFYIWSSIMGDITQIKGVLSDWLVALAFWPGEQEYIYISLWFQSIHTKALRIAYFCTWIVIYLGSVQTYYAVNLRLAMDHCVFTSS